MSQHIISIAQARKIILHAAGLTQPGQFGTGREAVYNLIDHLGHIQIDTNYVVERAHHHSIWVRVPDYELHWLNELQDDGKIFEFFMADSGFMPMHNFRFSLPVKESFATNRKPLSRGEVNLMNDVLNRIEREGPLMVTDFENDRLEASSGWWDWRPAKMALERLYLDGKLMTTRRKDFKKLYDLPLNIVPHDTDTTMPAPEEFARHTIRRTLQALGIASAKEMGWRARYLKNHLVKKEVEKMAAEGEICRVTVEDLKSAQLYMLPKYKDANIHLSGQAYILSPFDVLNVFRHRLRDFFDFNYQVECFVPAPKRIYGYFSLPVLVGDTFIARMDAKADRKQKLLIVHNLHFEQVEVNNEQIDSLIQTLKAFIKFNQCQNIVINKSNNQKYLAKIARAMV